MDDKTVEVMNTDSNSAAESEVISTNPVLTLITTEDGIPTSTEVTVLTTTLGNVPLMTASLGTLSEVPLVTTGHPTFVTSHPGVRTVYATSINPSDGGQQVVVGEGQIAVLETDGVQQTIVVHADPSQLTALAQAQAQRNEGQPHLISVSLPSVTVQSNEEIAEVLQKEGEVEAEVETTGLEQHVHQTDTEVIDNDEQLQESANSICGKPSSESQAEITQEMETSDCTDIIQNNGDVEVEKKITPLSLDTPIPEEVVCLVCYQAFVNPKCRKKDGNNEKDESVDCENSAKGDGSSIVPSKSEAASSENTLYGRPLGKFFEVSRINMSIVTRRSYKEYDVPICQNCNAKLEEAEEILEELRRLERDLYYLRQRIKDEIFTSYAFYKNKENQELVESRRKIPGLIEILDIVDRIREDIINDGRPPKIPRSIGSSTRAGRKPKKLVNTTEEPTESIKEKTPAHSLADESTNKSIGDGTDVPQTSSTAATAATETPKLGEGEKKTEIEDETKSDKPAIRTSFGRLIKRPTYILNETLSDDELSELGESSEDNYEEIEVKPELPPVEGGESSIIKEEEIDEEDPAWSPGRGLFISDRVGIPPSTSDESDNFSEEDSDAEITPKVKAKKEPKEKKARKAKQSNKRKSAKRVRVVKQEDVNYEVKVIQLDGTELMTINTRGADENIGLEPDITQKVMDSQAVIMVKNQLFGKRVQCHHCPRTFTDPHRRDIHVKKKHEGVSKPFECEVCQKRFSRQDHLRNHMKRHMRPPKDRTFKPKPSTSEKNHSCEYCEQRFRNKSELAVHIRLHTGERPYKCEHCAEAFVSALKREFHIEQMHPDVPPLRCEFCSKGFFRQHRLRIHAVSHTGEKANICELCGKSFSQAAMLRYHQTTHEELNLKQFKCQECSRVFANPQNLKSHMESQHQKMYRHRCPHCDRGYTQMSHLRRHLRTHSGEQPFICSYCPKRFTSGAALKIHVRIHTGERPYWCSLCEKGFRSKTKLGRHLKTLIHSGENKDRIKKETVTTEIETVDVNAATTTTWTEIVGIITGV